MTLIQLDPVRNHCQIRGAGLDSGPVTSSWVGLRSRQEVNVKSELEPEGQTTMAMVGGADVESRFQLLLSAIC